VILPVSGDQPGPERDDSPADLARPAPAARTAGADANRLHLPRGYGSSVCPRLIGPAQVPEAAVAKLVAGLTYDDRGTRRAVVHQDSVPELAAALVKGLARADATSRVRFLVMNPGRTMFFFRSTTSTRGVAFVKPAGVLNLAFDLVDDVTEFEDDEWVDAITGSRSEVEINPPAGAQYHVNADGKTSNPRWIVLPLGPGPSLPATRVTAIGGAGTEAAANRTPVLDTTRTALPTGEPRPESVVPAPDSKPTQTQPPADQPASQDRPDQLVHPDRALPGKAPDRSPAGTATPVKTGTNTKAKKPLTSEQILQRLRTLLRKSMPFAFSFLRKSATSCAEPRSGESAGCSAG
jgi:hypothetical protein